MSDPNCKFCQNGNLRDCGYPADYECINGIAMDIDAFHEGYERDVVRHPAPCHPQFCMKCGGTGEWDGGDCPDCDCGYRDGKMDYEERLSAAHGDDSTDEVSDLTAEIARLKAELEEARAEFNIQCRAIGNWREWGNKPESDHEHPDWEVATKAIIERDEARAAAGAMREALEKIGGLAGSCVIQRAPSDDKIIADHIEEIRDIAGAALAKARGVL